MPIKNQFNNKRIKIDTITGASIHDELGIFDETNNYSKNSRCFWNSKFYISNTAITGGDRGDLSNAPDVSTDWNLISSPPDTIYQNAVINGDMAVSQRGTSFTSPTLDYTLDRWYAYFTSAVVSQDTSNGYSSLKVSQTGTDGTNLMQPILGRRLYDFVGKKLQLRFKVKSSKTGIFSISLGYSSKGYTAEYTIDTANVEQEIEIEIAELPLAQLFSTGNALGLYLNFNLFKSLTSTVNTWLDTNGGSPSVNQVDLPDGGTFYLRDVQLTAGDVNLPYKKPSYYESLAECQRYFIKEVVKDLAIDGYSTVASTYNVAHIRFPEMRETPSVTNLSSTTSLNVSSFQQTVRSNSFVEPKIRNSSSGRYYRFGITFDLDAEL